MISKEQHLIRPSQVPVPSFRRQHAQPSGWVLSTARCQVDIARFIRLVQYRDNVQCASAITSDSALDESGDAGDPENGPRLSIGETEAEVLSQLARNEALGRAWSLNTQPTTAARRCSSVKTLLPGDPLATVCAQVSASGGSSESDCRGTRCKLDSGDCSQAVGTNDNRSALPA